MYLLRPVVVLLLLMSNGALIVLVYGDCKTGGLVQLMEQLLKKRRLLSSRG
jgi:hypothetical protein